MISDMEVAVRLLVSCLLGGFIGFERRKKSAGLRTHILVCIGACLLTVLSINIYEQVEGLTNADPSRLAAQIISGIGFLGAGAIYKEGLTVKGLTTGASIWVVSGVGIAVGAGYYTAALQMTGLIFLTLHILYRMEKQRKKNLCRITIATADKPGQIQAVTSFINSLGLDIRKLEVEQVKDNELTLLVVLCLEEKLDFSRLEEGIGRIEGVRSVKRA